MNKRTLEKIASENGSPIIVIDHEEIRKNYQEFKKRLPRVQAYYAVKANSEPEIIKTMYKLGASYDVASIREFRLVLDTLSPLLTRDSVKLQEFVWNRIIYANPAKQPESLPELNMFRPLLTYDCEEEMQKIKDNCPNAGVLLRLSVSNEGAIVLLGNKFGKDPKEAIDLIGKTIDQGIQVEGLSFHVGSQCSNLDNFRNAIRCSAEILNEADKRGYEIGETVTTGRRIKLVDIGGGFPVKYNGDEQHFGKIASVINQEIKDYLPKKDVNILAEPGRFLVASSGTAVSRVILAKHSTSPTSYHLDDGIYHTFSGALFDHMPIHLEAFKSGEKTECRVFGPTCDGLDVLTENPYIPHLKNANLPKLKLGDRVYSKNMGAYSIASSTSFNGFPSAKIVHVNV